MFNVPFFVCLGGEREGEVSQGVFEKGQVIINRFTGQGYQYSQAAVGSWSGKGDVLYRRNLHTNVKGGLLVV